MYNGEKSMVGGGACALDWHCQQRGVRRERLYIQRTRVGLESYAIPGFVYLLHDLDCHLAFCTSVQSPACEFASPSRQPSFTRPKSLLPSPVASDL